MEKKNYCVSTLDQYNTETYRLNSITWHGIGIYCNLLFVPQENSNQNSFVKASSEEEKHPNFYFLSTSLNLLLESDKAQVFFFLL